ncbi:hypothetical protein LMG27177_00989 [Paraburkholderia fynbosensis]|uniref:Uncharacterized protein n=1 Tax=Paraburkholderia fynbosensis TaxID=1200993 RepID=A0A6J5FLQ8_9BURK|nr:hypothetical protein LMG27177_00989 [Paraburkholderia fynbosensis]
MPIRYVAPLEEMRSCQFGVFEELSQQLIEAHRLIPVSESVAKGIQGCNALPKIGSGSGAHHGTHELRGSTETENIVLGSRPDVVRNTRRDDIVQPLFDHHVPAKNRHQKISPAIKSPIKLLKLCVYACWETLSQHNVFQGC